MRSMLRNAALLAVFLLTAQAPAPAPTMRTIWCTTIPLPAQGCRPLVVQAPRETLRLAVVVTEALRERGLMFVSAVPPGQGMLFVFSRGDAQREFWMKNTIAPLDMVFVGDNGTVTTVAADVPKTTPETPDAQIPRRSGVGTFVIELAAGEAARAGISSGTRLAIPHILAE
jgi:uncharacterized membrane protein (UPF0127 family)